MQYRRGVHVLYKYINSWAGGGFSAPCSLSRPARGMEKRALASLGTDLQGQFRS